MRIVAYLFAFVVSFSSSAYAGQFFEQTVVTSDGDRTFWIYLPKDAPDASTPVVLVFHGDGGTAQGISVSTGFNAFAEANNFIAIYPQAAMVGGEVRFNTYVDAAPGHAGLGIAQCVDDVEFTTSILNWLTSTYGLTLSHVYASGHSGGGFMCYNLALQMRERLTAIAPVSANMWGDDAYVTAKVTSNAWTPLPVMHIHGTADNVVDYPDKDRIPKSYEEWPLPAFSFASCGADTYTGSEQFMGATKYIFCNGATPVWLIGIEGMGHTWTNGIFPTTQAIVEFFGLIKPTSVVDVIEHEYPSAIMIESGMQVELHGFDSEQQITIYDITGSVVSQLYAISLNTVRLQPGLYQAAQANGKQVRLVVY